MLSVDVPRGNAMRRSRYFIALCFFFFSFTLALSAAGIAFLSGAFPGKSAIAGMLFGFSLLSAVIGLVVLRTMNSFIAQSEHFATRDPLTNLYNRRTFWDFLRYEIERSKRQGYRFTLMLVDLDNFKVLNDTCGHEVGDAYLVECSSLFKASIRKGDIAARYGGDDFSAILPVCDEGQAYIVARRLLDDLHGRSFLLPNGSSVQITASIGMAVYPDHAQDAESLFLVADTMLHQAKLLGKDRMRLPGEDMNLATLKSAGEKSIFIMEALRKKQFVPYFQPIVGVKERSILAYEVLTRIVTSERVFPALDFIDAAEGMGAIGKIDYLLIEQAFDLMKRRRYEGSLFLNLSPKALVMNEFVPTVRGLMKTYGIEPQQMVFEITERDTVKDLGLSERTVRSLKSEGFRFAIDDFGSGYASFQYIKLFQVDFLKIDGEFIRNMAGNGGLENSIVTNIAGLAEQLGIKTIAEFVESEEILGKVQSAGINYAQGYYIRPPMPDLLE